MFFFILIPIVTINGTNLFGYGSNITQVKLGDAHAEILYEQTDNSSILVRATRLNVSENTPVDITIIADTNAMVASSGQPFSYLKEGEITNVFPNIGQIGTIVNITGINLLGGGSKIKKIYIDGIKPDSIANVSASTIIVVLGNHELRDPDNYPGEIYIESTTGTIVTGGQFTQMAPGNITSVVPTKGRLGTEITLTGYNLTGFGNSIETVFVGEYAVITDTQYMTTLGDTKIVIEAPDAPKGHSGPVKLLIDTGAIVTSTQVFTFLQQGNITQVIPVTGGEGRGVFVEGTSLNINGLDLVSVTVGRSEAHRIVTDSETQVTFIAGPAPNGSLTSLPVRITLSDGSYTDGGSFTYEEYSISVLGASIGQYGTEVELEVPFPVEDVLSIKFDDVEADIIETDDSSNLTLTVKAPRARLLGNYSVDITVENINNIVARLRNGFSYLTEGFICTVYPSEGQKGTRVQITGENMLGRAQNISKVTFGNVSAKVDSYSDREINVSLTENLEESQHYPQVVDVTVVSVTGAILTLVDGFTLIEPGKITAVSPSSGQYGTEVTIMGVGLIQDNKDVVSVTLAGIEADIIGTPFDTNILVQAISSNASNGSVIVVLSTGAQISSNQSIQFQYLDEGEITQISPSNGTEGTLVSLYGKNLLGGGSGITSITLGKIPASVEEANDSYILVSAGGGGNTSAPPGDIVIMSDTGALVSLEGVWTFNEPGYISEISPMSGQQGVIVTIEGSGLLAGPNDHVVYVAMAGVQALVLEQTNTKILAEAVYSDYELNMNPVSIKLKSGPLIISSVNWTYYNASLQSITPTSGVNGTYITLNGRNIIGEPNTTFNVSMVKLGGILCYDIQVISQDSVRVRAGYSENATSMGEARIDSTSGAYLVLHDQWEYLQNGEILSVSPSSAVPGENITITGTRLVPPGATSVQVTFGQSESFSTEILNTSIISVRVGVYASSDGPEVTVPLYIVANDGSTVATNDTFFTFKTTSIANSVTPSAGQTGTIVVINGTDLFDKKPISVHLAGVKAKILHYSKSNVTVKAGEGDGVRGSVTIVLRNGTFTGLGGSAWTYLPVLNSSHVSPISGRNGTLVSITTTAIPSEFELQSVYLGDIQATIVSIVDGMVLLYAGHSDSPSDMDNVTMYFQDNITLVIEASWSYQSPASIKNDSTLQGYYNAIISLNGTGFRGGDTGVPVSSVSLAGFSTEILVQADTSLIVKITDNFDSSSGPVKGPVVIVSEDGAEYDSTSENITFTYIQVRVDSVSPRKGQNGTRVTLTGVGLLAGADNVTSVTLADVEVASIERMSDTQITASAAGYNRSTEPGNIKYILSSGAVVSISDTWSYLPLGEISAVIPINGSRGTLVTILGERLLGGGETAGEVYLNGVKAMEVVVNENEVVQVRAGESIAKEFGEIQIVANTGAVLTSNKPEVSFKYIEPGRIDGISPISGQFGTAVTINGLDLHRGEGVSSVTIAGVEATIVSYNSSSVEVIAQRPSTITSFSGTVLVESDDKSLIESSANFTYLREGDITLVTPLQGQFNAEVVIGGNRLFGGGGNVESVIIAGVPADILSQTNTKLRVRIKENNESVFGDITGDIVITADTGAQVSLVDSWTYVQVGVITSLVPESGQYGTRVNITGERLTAGGMSIEKVIVGGVESIEVLSSSTNEVVFRAGYPTNQTSAFTAGPITLVSSDGGEIDSPMTWNYIAASQIFDVSPANGTGGTVIVISGVNLLGGNGLNITSVLIAGIRANEIISQNDTMIIVEVGFNSDGQEKGGDIVIEADSGALTILRDGWVYLNECPIGQFGNNTNSCSLCDPECEHCHGPSEYECYSCKNFRIIKDSQTQCVSKCPSFSTIDKECKVACGTNQFQQIELDSVTYCINCHPQCDPSLSCSGDAPSQCSACLNVELNGECVESCGVGYFVANGTTCFPCSEQCEQEAGCRGPSPHECNECLNVTIFKADEQVDECIPFCPSEYYTNSTGFCQSCHPQCLGGCSGPSSSDCYQCKNGAFTDSDGVRQCVEECNQNSKYKTYFKNSTDHCVRCHSFCSVTAGCNGPLASDCNACLNFTGSNTDVSQFLPHLDGACVMECPSLNYYVDLRTGECLLCHENCSCGCYGPDITECNCSTESTSLLPTRPTESHSLSVFEAGYGAIALATSISVVVFLVLIIVILILACKLRKASNSGKGEYRFAESGENPIIQMQVTKFTGAPLLENGRRNSSANREHSSTVNPLFQDNQCNESRRNGSGTQSAGSMTNRNEGPISSINPVFRVAPTDDRNVPQTEDHTPASLNEPEVELSQTMSEAYMEMEFDYQQHIKSESVNEPTGHTHLVLRQTSSSGSTDPGPPLPPKPGNRSSKTYKPPPVVPQEQNFVVYEDDSYTYPEPEDKDGGHFINELSTQEEMETIPVNVLGTLPLPPAGISLHPQQITMIEEDIYVGEESEAVYEETDSMMPEYHRKNHQLVQEPLPPVLPKGQEPLPPVPPKGQEPLPPVPPKGQEPLPPVPPKGLPFSVSAPVVAPRVPSRRYTQGDGKRKSVISTTSGHLN